MTLSKLAIILGLTVGVIHTYGLINPAKFKTFWRSFPRSLPWGYLLMTAATVWFLWNLKNESISDFAAYKRAMYIIFAGIAVGTCIFVTDFLAARGLGVFFLVLAKLMVDTARWAETDWRWVISGWAYVLVIAGMWFTISPWRVRDLIEWATENEKRIRIGSAIRAAFGFFVAALGFFVY